MPRSRTTGSLSAAQYTIEDFNPVPPQGNGARSSSTLYTSLNKAQGYTSTMGDSNNGNFAKAKASGVIIMSACNLQRTQRQTQSSSWNFGPHALWGRRTIVGDLACAAAVMPVLPTWYATRITDAKYSTITEANAKVAAADFQGLVSIAEAKKTIVSISKPFAASLDLANKVLGRKLSLIKSGLTAAQAAAKAWNEYRFGWKPLLYDIQGAADAYVDAAKVKPVRLVARSSHRVDYNNTQAYFSSGVGGLSSLKMSVTFALSSKISSGVLYELTDVDNRAAVQRATGTRLSDIPATVWELVPFSFVVDRFLTVGSWLNAMTPKPGVKILGSWTTTVKDESFLHTCVEGIVDLSGSTPSVKLSQSGGTYYEKNFSYVREISPQIPIAPTWNPKDLNLQQQIDHVALIYDKLVSIFK